MLACFQPPPMPTWLPDCPGGGSSHLYVTIAYQTLHSVEATCRQPYRLLTLTRCHSTTHLSPCRAAQPNYEISITDLEAQGARKRSNLTERDTAASADLRHYSSCSHISRKMIDEYHMSVMSRRRTTLVLIKSCTHPVDVRETPHPSW